MSQNLKKKRRSAFHPCELYAVHASVSFGWRSNMHYPDVPHIMLYVYAHWRTHAAALIFYTAALNILIQLVNGKNRILLKIVGRRGKSKSYGVLITLSVNIDTFPSWRGKHD